MDREQRKLHAEFDDLVSRHEKQMKEWEHKASEDEAQRIRLNAEFDAEQRRCSTIYIAYYKQY